MRTVSDAPGPRRPPGVDERMNQRLLARWGGFQVPWDLGAGADDSFLPAGEGFWEKLPLGCEFVQKGCHPAEGTAEGNTCSGHLRAGATRCGWSRVWAWREGWGLTRVLGAGGASWARSDNPSSCLLTSQNGVHRDLGAVCLICAWNWIDLFARAIGGGKCELTRGSSFYRQFLSPGPLPFAALRCLQMSLLVTQVGCGWRGFTLGTREPLSVRD